MAKLVLSDLGTTLSNSAANVINTNNARIAAALEKTLSRDGSTPNQMEADLDLNNYDIVNVNSVETSSLSLNGTVVTLTNLVVPEEFATAQQGENADTALALVQTALQSTSNLADVANEKTSRENLGVDRPRLFTPIYGGNFTSSSEEQVLLSTATSTNYWHFGGMAYEPMKDRLHFFYRDATDHLLAQSVVKYFYTDDGGSTLWSYTGDGVVVSGASTILTSPVGRDYRDISCGVSPEGDIYFALSDVPITGSTPPTSLRVWRSTNGGVSFTQRNVLDTLPGAVGRVRGRIKWIPGKGKRRMMITAWEEQAGVSDVNTSLVYYSDDGGETFSAGTAPFAGGPENETEVAFWSNVGIAVARKNTASSGAISLSISTNHGTTWTQVSDVLDSGYTCVAPTVDIIRDKFGTAWVLVGACARASDTMRWWSGRLKDVITSGGAALTAWTDTSTDMQALSGYHCPQILPSGEMISFEVKEDNVGGRVLRLRRIQPESLCLVLRPWTPVLTFQTPGNLAVTYSRQFGMYYQEGHKVTVTYDITTSAFTHTTASGQLRITGLPKSSNNMLNTQIVGAGGVEYAGITRAGLGGVTARLQQNVDYLNFRSSGTGIVAADVTTAEVPSGGNVRLIGTFTYWTND